MATIDAAINFITKKLTDKHLTALPEQDGGIWVVRFGKPNKGWFGAVVVPNVNQSDEDLTVALNAAIKEAIDVASKEPVLRG